jgi:hypothetical protein
MRTFRWLWSNSRRDDRLRVGLLGGVDGDFFALAEFLHRSRALVFKDLLEHFIALHLVGGHAIIILP